MTIWIAAIIKTIHYKRSPYILHLNVFKTDSFYRCVLASSTTGFDPQAAVCILKDTFTGMKISHTASHLTSYRNSSMTIFHITLTDF